MSHVQATLVALLVVIILRILFRCLALEIEHYNREYTKRALERQYKNLWETKSI